MSSIFIALLLCLLSFLYLRVFADEPTRPFQIVAKVFSSHKHPTWKLRPRFLPKATKAALSSIAGTGEGLWQRLYARIFHAQELAEVEDDVKYQAGESYGDPDVLATGLVKDLSALGLKGKRNDLRTLIQLVKSKGKPIDDRQMLMEKVIAIVAMLPRTSKSRQRLTGILVDQLWQSLEHPPLSYFGNKYQYRTPDGSYNNPLEPDLGKAGSPYARSVPRLKALHGVQPDPGLLFDLLMARDEGTFRENPAGISSVLFYHASIIIHDVFCTNRRDPNISDTSSYLDLAPLYGSSYEDQLRVRTMERGMLKPDTFHEKRLLGQPPGVNVILVMYNRFHNYVADVLLKINENGRFTLPPTTSEDAKRKALAKQDEDLFQVTRLIVNGLYVNISLHDYLRGLTNTHHSASDWTLDPRVAVSRAFDADGVPRGVGNQVSAEFNLLYRFHSVISRRDEQWTNEFLKSLFPDLKKPLEQLTPQEFMQGLITYERSIEKDPSKREFGGLKRNQSGRFNDAELVQILKDSMEDPAGLFGARMVPKALRMVEIAGILTARKWNLASLNEMRDFFKLKRHSSFEDINPDPKIADLLRKLYDHPDMVEMYPGIFLEDAKPAMDPGCGGCPPYTVGRAVFSDAVTLVRSDRFLTLDYTASNLTNWGIREVQQDYDILGGSMFHKLIQRALPGWFPYNSLHATQPMFTRKMNEQIAKEIGTIDRYSQEDPKPPTHTVMLAKYETIIEVLKDQDTFRVPWARYLNDMLPGKRFNDYMLGGDGPGNTAQKKLVKSILFSPDQFSQLLSHTTVTLGKELLELNTLQLSTELNQVDIIRDVAIPLNARIMADLFCLDMKTPENESGSMNAATVYKHLMNVRTWGFNNNDPGLMLQRRKWASESAEALVKTTLKVVNEQAQPQKTHMLASLTGHKQSVSTLRWYGNNVAKQMMEMDMTAAETAEICWLTAVGGVGAPVGLIADVLQYYLRPENIHHWKKIQNLVSQPDNSGSIDKLLRQYVLEAQRLTSMECTVRVCRAHRTINDQEFKPGDVVITLLGPACRDPSSIPDAETFKLDRPSNAYIHFGYGAHECLGKEIALTFAVSMLRVLAGLKYLRPAPGDMGMLKSIVVDGRRVYLNDSWSWMTQDPTKSYTMTDGGMGMASQYSFGQSHHNQYQYHEVTRTSSSSLPSMLGDDESYGRFSGTLN
ncbi:peroxidase/cytochrome P450 family protein [Aspergillus vadensis CBS 113365]|uniref:linoleate 8R-lipoxygenase n=1 Tax=Aspergillus vadensis (strain CBS 113365 / IMI 142717 / IBT 24658) TaxID=1448311 RepID=A0A319B627_ASPVC|nr:heme peroxidase [Aspergillus vadensis CBS 113365]PYH67779.1 heme peroxidase [Aspergillus vadensis CBS 113365]